MYFGDQFSINRIYFRDSAVCSLAPVEMGPRAVAARGPGAGGRAQGRRRAVPSWAPPLDLRCGPTIGGMGRKEGSECGAGGRWGRSAEAGGPAREHSVKMVRQPLFRTLTIGAGTTGRFCSRGETLS